MYNRWQSGPGLNQSSEVDDVQIIYLNELKGQ